MVRNHKCFLATPQGMESIKPLNIIVGRNNSGKSAFLEAILNAFSSKSVSSPELILDREIDDDLIDKLSDDRQEVRVGNQTEAFIVRRYAKILLKTRLQFVLIGDRLQFDGSSIQGEGIHEKKLRAIGSRLAPLVGVLLRNWQVCRISSERDVIPESSEKRVLTSNGGGLTSLFCSLMLGATDNRLDLVENTIVPALNEILFPDNRYERILLRSAEGIWELYLDEQSKGPIPLSSTGSGVKTILLVLANLLVLPEFGDSSNRHRFVFAFEELENNLHPATLRRLFKFIARYSIERKCPFFITTHSHIVIDMFSRDEDAQILHVEHNGQSASIRTIKTRNDGANVLSDLDVRASDLLQTNVVIWVEGPTDAMYLERWIDIHSSGDLRRGIDYQCVCYGGSVGTHLTFDTENADKLIEATKICRHSVFIADSNRDSTDSKICDETQRIAKEVDDAAGYGWITDGREIENYLPLEIVSSEAGATLDDVTKYTDIYQAIKTARGNTTEMSKVVLANRVIPKLSKENAYQDDLKDKLDAICERIKAWNGLIGREPS